MTVVALVDFMPTSMAKVPDLSEMLSAVRPLVDAGVAVHWLHRRSKRPVGDQWQTAAVHTVESLTAAYQSGFNIGIRPGEHSNTAAGYLHLIDLDIRDASQADVAWAALLRLWPDARSAPFVISGSGGESRHIYFVTDKPFRSLKLAKSTGFSMVPDADKGRDVKKYDWEVELFGAPKQAVLPPSVHPDTGEQYRWGREIDFDLLEMGVGPIVSTARVEGWGANLDGMTLDEDDDLLSIVRAEPMGLTETEIADTIADLPETWVDDRDQWLQVGAALHHEYRGARPGFDRWCDWSRQSTKYDAKDQVRVWKSFKGNSRKPVRMATLLMAAGQARLEREHSDLDDLLGGAELPPADAPIPSNQALVVVPTVVDDDLDDLLGPISQSIAPGAVGAVDPEWKRLFERTEDGKSIKATLHNVELIVRHDSRFRGVAGFNEFTNEIVQRGVPRTFKLGMARTGTNSVRQLDSPIWRLRDTVNGDLWNDSRDGDLRLLLETPTRQGGYSLKTSDRDLRVGLDKVAHLNRFHPVRDYLNRTTWDGVNRVATLFVDYLGAEDNAYHREAALLWMLGAVTRAFEPGHKFDFVPILEGFQGKRKSTFVSILARFWFSELEGDFHDTKAMVEKMQGSWILEIPELQGFSKAEVTTIKGFVSRTFDKVRLAYAKRASEFHRQCVFIGSTNDHEYLRDSTGGRRFWPIACRVVEIDTDRLQTEVDQLWAEAKCLYDTWRANQPHGTLPLYMKNPVAAAYAKELQESRRQQGSDDALAGRIEAWLAAPIGSELGFDDVEGEEPVFRNEVCLLQIWEELMERDRNAYPDRDQQMLARAIRKVEGWVSVGRQYTPKYGQQRVYGRVGFDPTSSERPR